MAPTYHARHTVHRFSHALRRPMAVAAAILAVAGASAAASSSASPHLPGLSSTAGSNAAQTSGLSGPADIDDDTDGAMAAARRSDIRQAAALAHARQGAAEALIRARVQAAAAMIRSRAASERVSRAHVRQSIMLGARSNPRAVGRQMAADRGWGDQQFACLDRLWARESGWRWNANNGGSGAYGIPQSLPGSKMASAGSDWQSNPITQITWGLGYVARSYGTPCSAWAHSQSAGWY